MKTILLRYTVVVACAAAQLRASGAGDPLDYWSQMDATGPVPAYAIRHGGGKWLGFDPHGRLVSSTNGFHWQVSRTFEADEGPSDLDYANGLWVLVGAQSTNVFLLTSENGATWDRAILPAIPPYERGYLTSGLKVRRGGGEWIVRVRNRWVLKSTNGRNWALSPLGPPACEFCEIYDLTYGDHRWVAQVKLFDIPFPFACSTNLIDWEWWNPWPAGCKGCVFDGLKFFNGVWFGVLRPVLTDAIAGFTQQLPVLTSTDGTNWIVRHVGRDLRDLSIINGRLVALSYTGPSLAGQNVGSGLMLTSDPLVSLQLATRGALTVQRAAGMPVVVEWTEDFHTWQTLTNLASGQPLETVTDSTDGITKRFYRAHSP